MPQNNELFANRDLSWLSFNYRILMEAANRENPLFERLNFQSIFASNLDEFFVVRVAWVKNLMPITAKKIQNKLGFEPAELLQQIQTEVSRQLDEFGHHFRQELLPGLWDAGIHLYYQEAPTEAHLQACRRLFDQEIRPFVQPSLFSAHLIPPYLENHQLYLFLRLRYQENGESAYGLVNIPAEALQRFWALPTAEGRYHYIFLEDILRANFDRIFPGTRVEESYSIKLSRDADLHIEDECSGDLIERIRQQVRKRDQGEPTRFLYDGRMPQAMLDFLTQTYQIPEAYLVEGGYYHNFFDFADFPNPLQPQLEAPKPQLVPYPPFDASAILPQVEARDHLLSFPYQSYDYILRYFNEIALDPEITDICITLYRIAPDSGIAGAMVGAARSGKNVTVFVEVKARFDESNNLRWAKIMEKAGVNIYYSMPELKVHAKVAYARKQRPDGSVVHYSYLGTGNFNESTARFYADHALLTTDPQTGEELQGVFDLIQRREPSRKPERLLVSQDNMKDRFLALLDREIINARAGKPARAIIKINNLEEEAMIQKLSEASQAGVQVDMLVRSICCLRPGVEGLSDNIRVVRVVDQLLEHARIFYFHNNGAPDFFMGSADWMLRNLHKRIEVVFPVEDPEHQAELKKLLDLQLSDNQRAVELDAQLNNRPIRGASEPIRCQEAFRSYLQQKMVSGVSA